MGRPELYYHVSGRKLDVEGEEPDILTYVQTKLKRKFLTGQDE